MSPLMAMRRICLCLALTAVACNRSGGTTPAPPAQAATPPAIANPIAADSPTALCDGIVTRIRNNSGVVSGASQEDVWSMVTSGEHPYLEVSERAEMRIDVPDRGDTKYLDQFRAAFASSDALDKVIGDFVRTSMSYSEVYSLPGADLHMASQTDGTALCQSVIFFGATKGQPAQLLPDAPKAGDRDGDNLICSGYGSSGYLARVNGVEAFLVHASANQSHRFRVVPVRERKWAPACTVEAQFHTVFSIDNVFVPANGPVTDAAFRPVAAQASAQWSRANEKDRTSLTFGPAVPDRDADRVRAMIDLVAKMTAEPIPAFGRDKDLGDFDALRSGDSYPLVLNGQTYLMRVGQGQNGCCYLSDPIVVLYSLKDAKLDPVASALAATKRGPLESLRAVVSR